MNHNLYRDGSQRPVFFALPKLFKAAFPFRKLLLLLLFSALFCLPLLAKDWTILVYMGADNGLYPEAVQNINDMESINISNNVNLIVQLDRPDFSGNPGCTRYLIQQDNRTGLITSPVISELGMVDSGNYQTLHDFAAWGFRKYPSTKKALVIWSHGNSWYKKGGEKWIGMDEESSSVIGVWNGQLRQALSDLPQMDILLFDACSMQSAEVITEVYDKARYIIGSEDLVPARGFPYSRMLPHFIQSLATKAIADSIVHDYIHAYLPGGYLNEEELQWKLSCSALDTQKWQPLLDKLDVFARAAKQIPAQIMIPRGYCEEFNDMEADIDLGELMFRVRSDNSNMELQELASQVHTALEAAFFSALSFNHPAAIHTATIWFPREDYTFYNLFAHYGKLRMAHTQWPSLLNAFYGPDTRAPEKPVITRAVQSLSSLQIFWEQAADPDYPDLFYQVQIRDTAKNLHGKAIYVNSALRTTLAIPTGLSSGYVFVKTIDPAGNESAVDSMYFAVRQVDTQIYVSPNPLRTFSEGKLSIYAENVNAGFILRIYDISGKCVISKTCGAGEFTNGSEHEIRLPFSIWGSSAHLSTGIYLVTAEVGAQVLRTKLVIVQ